MKKSLNEVEILREKLKLANKRIDILLCFIDGLENRCTEVKKIVASVDSREANFDREMERWKQKE